MLPNLADTDDDPFLGKSDPEITRGLPFANGFIHFDPPNETNAADGLNGRVPFSQLGQMVSDEF